MLVVNDPQLAESIGRLRGEWAERTSGTITAAAIDWNELPTDQPIDADVVFFPARYLGDLAERGALRPVRESVWNNPAYGAADLLPLPRQRLIVYGDRTLAVPLGVVVSLVGYRAEWLTQRGGTSPATWDEYLELVRRTGESPVWWPDDESAASTGVTFLARAAAYAAPVHVESALFDLESFEPRLTDVAFVRALDEWIEEQTLLQDANAGEPSRIVWAEPPGDLQRVPLVSDGLLAGVTSSSRNTASAFQLLAWLAGPEISAQLTSDATYLPSRRSQLSQLRRSFDSPLGAADGASLNAAVETALSRDHCLMAPRIPGSDEYLATLGTAIEAALTGELSASAALQQASAAWEAITNRRGRDAQREAYLRHLGIAGP